VTEVTKNMQHLLMPSFVECKIRTRKPKDFMFTLRLTAINDGASWRLYASSLCPHVWCEAL